MAILLAVSDDYWGARAEAIAASYPDVVVVVDRSGGVSRALKLVARGSIPIRAAVHIFIAAHSLPPGKPVATRAFANNPEVRNLAAVHDASMIVLFRAGLIISGATLEGYKVINVHCADIHGFGGLASIWRALKAEAVHQCATLHEVTSRIDDGEVVDTEAYRLEPSLGYSKNEHLAYEAGLRLLNRTLSFAQSEHTRR